MFLRVKVYTSLVVRQIVFLSETSVGLFEQDYHFGPGGKRSPGRARDAKILLARPGSALANASGRVDFSKPGCNLDSNRAFGKLSLQNKNL